jgi:DNA-damage-inducible protein J
MANFIVTTKEKTMATMTIEVDETVRAEADAVLAELGLTVSALVQTLLTRIAREKTVPFDAGLEKPDEEERARIERIKDAIEQTNAIFALEGFEPTEQTRAIDAAVLAELGLTVSALVQTLLTRIVREKAVPFDAGREKPVISEEEKRRRRLWHEQALASTRLEGHIPTPEFLDDCEAVIEGTLSREEARERSLARALAADRAARELSDGEAA